MNPLPLGRRALAGLGAALVGCTPSVPRPQPVAPGFLAGAVTHFIQNDQGMEQALDMLRDAGFASLRDEVYWHLVEPEQGRLAVPEVARRFVDGAHARGIAPVITLDYGNPHWDGGDKPRSPTAIEAFVRYAETVAEAFRGKVTTYEIWNEWHWQMGGTTPGTPEEYLRLFAATATALRRIEPNLRLLADQVVMDDGDDALVARMARAGAFGLIDGITVHPYFFNRGEDRTPEAWAQHMQSFDAVLRRHNGGRSVPLHVTEIGWPTHLGRFGVSRPRQAALAARLFILARTLPFVPGVWWYDFRDDGTDLEEAEQNFGLVTASLAPKPALATVNATNRALAGSSFLQRLGTRDSKVWALSFAIPSGQQLWALWQTAAMATRPVQLSGLPEDAVVIDLAQPEPFTPVPFGPKRGTLTLTEWPILLVGRMTEATRIEAAAAAPVVEQAR